MMYCSGVSRLLSIQTCQTPLQLTYSWAGPGLSGEHLQLSPLHSYSTTDSQARSCQYSANYKNCLSLKYSDMKSHGSYTELDIDPASCSQHFMFIQREIFNTEIKVCWKDKSLQQPGNLNNNKTYCSKGKDWATLHCTDRLTVQFLFSLEPSYLLDCPGL